MWQKHAGDFLKIAIAFLAINIAVNVETNNKTIELLTYAVCLAVAIRILLFGWNILKQFLGL